MDLLINLSSRLLSEALYYLLKNEEGYNTIVSYNNDYIDDFHPNIVLVDIHSINSGIFFQYPRAKFVLVDTGIKQDDIIATLLSYRISGVLSSSIDLRLFKKALKVIDEGQIWFDNRTLKAFLHNAGLLSKNGRINGVTKKEREIIECVCQGYKNKQIASKLSLSEHTVKAHLNKIFRKFNVTNRSQLVAFTIKNGEFKER